MNYRRSSSRYKIVEPKALSLSLFFYCKQINTYNTHKNMSGKKAIVFLTEGAEEMEFTITGMQIFIYRSHDNRYNNLFFII